jgi:hypothetical protein
MLYKINRSFLYYKDKFDMTNDYYQNIVKIIKSILQNNHELSVNIMLCDKYNFNNTNKTLSIDINYEHTLVKKDGRDVAIGTPFGNVLDINNNKYYVRINKYDSLNSSDIIIDYSISNIYNVKSCELYDAFSKKHIYISSSIYKHYFIKANRNISTLTTFFRPLNIKNGHF